MGFEMQIRKLLDKRGDRFSSFNSERESKVNRERKNILVDMDSYRVVKDYCSEIGKSLMEHIGDLIKAEADRIQNEEDM